MKQALSLSILFILAAMVPVGFAQGRTREERTQPARASQKPAQDVAEKSEAEQVQESSEEGLRATLSKLSDQMAALALEIRKLRLESERSSMTLELLLNEERLARVEQRIEEALDFKMQLDTREQELQRRMGTVRQEAGLRGGLRREESENALWAEIQRLLDDVHNQQSAYQQRISELQAQASRLGQRVEMLRRRLEPAEGNKQ